MEGAPFGHYRLIELLGRGGMGEVWRAFDTNTSRIVAVKVLTAQLAADPTYGQRFRREALAAAGLNEPHVVPIHKFGEIDGRLYVDMRLIEGTDLEHLLARTGPLPAARAVHIVEQVAAALHAAHRIGLVHRDVKPSNILIGEDDFAYLIDFGIARSVHETGLTSAGGAIGTWAYMAPERFNNTTPDARSDVYALACVLYQALTAYQPYPGSSLEALLAGHLMSPPPRPSMTTNTVTTAMDDVIANGMAKNPDHRYPSTRDLALAARNAITAPIATPPLNYGPTVAHQHTHFAPPPQHSHVPLTQQAQSTLAPPQPPPKTGSKAKAIWITVASALTLLALVAATAIALTRHDSTPTATTSAAPSASDQPLTGSLRADFGALTDIAGKPVDNAGPTTETWTFRSTCPGGGCVATAAAGGPITAAPNWVFDEVDGQWLAVSVAPGKCQDLDAEFWRVIRLKKAADGSLTGQLVSAANVGCTTVRSLNMTRIGDADVTQLADPSSLPPRVPSPAEAFHGVYHQTLAFSPTDTYHYNYAVQTSCLRTGDRCASVLSDTDTNADQVRVWVFAGAKWSQYNDYSGICPGVGLNHFRDTAEYPLPQPAQDPINAITGKGTRQVPDGGLCVRGDFTSTLQRTGD